MTQEYTAVGELCEESRPSKDILWRIPNFKELSAKVDFWIYSPPFTLADATWCLQMFPNGQTQENTNGWIDLLLLRLNSNDPSHLVRYELGIITCNAKVCESFSDVSVFKDRDVEWGVAHLMKRTDSLNDSCLVSKDGVLTVFCEIQVSKEKNNSKLFESARNLLMPKMPEHLKVGELLEQTFPSCDITWTISDAFLLLDKSEYLFSPSFSFADASWCLQVYLMDEEKNAWLGMRLIKLCSRILKYETDFTLGIKNCFGKIYSMRDKMFFIGKSLTLKVLKYSNEEQSVIAPNGCVTSFCQMYIKENIQNYFFKSVADIPGAAPVEKKRKKVMPIKGLPSHVVMEEELHSASNTFSWVIHNFSSLSPDIGYFIDSSDFSFANAKWCLRLYPNGRKEDYDKESMHIFLIRLESCSTGHQIHFRLCLKKEETQTKTSIHVVSFNENVAKIGILNFLKRSEAMQFVCALNDIMTLTCDVIKAEEVGTVIPSLKEKQLSSALMTSARVLMLPPSDPKVFLWEICNIDQLSVSEDYFICSAEFSIAKATWCMKMYPFGRKKGDRTIPLFLVRLHSYHSYHRVHFKLGLKLTKRSKSTKRCKVTKECSSILNSVFYANNIEMGVVDFPEGILDCARNVNQKKKTLVAYCSIFYIEEISHLFAEPLCRYKETVGILDHSQQFYSETALSGTENINWKLKFPELPTGEDNFIDSPEFFFANAIWCLRIYSDHLNEWMQLFLLRLQSPCSDHHIHLRLGLKLRADKELATFVHEAYFHSNGAESGVVNLLKNSEAMISHKLYLPNDILTVFCEILLVDDLTAALSNQLICSQPIAVHHLQILESSQPCPTTTKLDSLKDVSMLLEIKMFSALPVNINYFIESEKFAMANATWCLRLYPNGKLTKKGYINRNMHLLLVRIGSDNSHHSIHYKIGLKKRPKGRTKRRENVELNSFIHVAYIDDNGLEVGVTNLIERSEVMNTKRRFLTEDTLTAFCQVWIIEEKTHSLPNPTNCPELAYDSSIPQIEMSKYFNFGQIAPKFSLEAKDVIWKILSADVESMEIGHAIDSPLFFFMNDYWRLRILVCAKISNDSHGCLELCLIKLNTPFSFSYEVSLKMFINDAWQDFQTSFSKGSLNTSIMSLGLTDIHFASDGYLQIYCQIIITSKGEKASRPLKVQKQVSGNSSNSEIQWGVLQELSFLESAQLTWVTYDFSTIENKIGTYVNSPIFELARNTWILQLYPNGLKQKSEYMCIKLIRLFSNAVDYDVVCEFYVKDSFSKRLLSKARSTFRGKCMQSCPAVLDLETFRKTKSTKPLSLLCRIFISESCEKASFEIPLTAANHEPLPNRNNGKDDLKPPKKNEPAQTSIIVEEKVNETVDELDFTNLKKKKKKLCKPCDTNCPVLENEDKSKFDKKNEKEDLTPPKKNEPAQTSTIVEEKVNETVDELDFTNLKKKKKKKICKPCDTNCPVLENEDKSKFEISANVVTPEYISVGELSVQSCLSKNILWKIPNFRSLSEESGFWIYSPLFTLANATWCLQMFPNGQTRESTDGWIDLLLLRLHSSNSAHSVWYKLGVIACNAKLYKSFSDFSTFRDSDVEWGVAHLMKRSDTLDNQLLISKDGILTVFCEIQVSEVHTNPVLFQSSSSATLQMPEHLKMGDLLEQSFPSNDITWKISDAFGTLDKEECQIRSPSFTFADASWCLQIYLIKEDEEEDSWLGLKLMKLCSNFLGPKIIVTLGIKNRFGGIYKSDKRIFRKKSFYKKSIKYLKKSTDRRYSIIAPNGCVTAFCQMSFKDEIQTYFSQTLSIQSDDVMEEQLSCGSKKFTWTMYNFYRLSTDEGYFIDSSQFSFANAKWCLRFYPNGLKEDYKREMHLLLVRLESCSSEHQIRYRLGLEIKNGKKIETSIHAANFNENVVEIGILNFFKRPSEVKRYLDPNNSITLFCEVIKVEEVRTVITSVNGRQLELAINTSCGVHMFPPSDPKVFLWTIPDCLELSVSDNYFISSQTFPVANATWCLKMYPYGRKEDKGWIHLFLVRLHSSNSYHRVHFKLGLQIMRQSKTAHITKQCRLTHNVVFYANNIEMGVMNFPQSILVAARKNNKKKRSLMAYCSIFFIEEISAVF